MNDIDAIFLDRDGTINEKPPEGAYVTNPAELHLLSGAAEAIRRINDVGIPVIVVTNQRGIARGLFSEDDLEHIHRKLRLLLARAGASVDAIYYCPHERNACDCRKPRPGMLTRAARDFGIDLRRTVLIGDSDSDVEAAATVGARAILLSDLPGRMNARSLADAIDGLRLGPRVSAAARGGSDAG